MFAAGMVKTITGGTRISYHAEGPDTDAWEADFAPPFKKLDLMKGLEAELNVKLPDPATLHTEGLMCSYCFTFVLCLSLVFLCSTLLFLLSGLSKAFCCCFSHLRSVSNWLRLSLMNVKFVFLAFDC